MYQDTPGGELTLVTLRTLFASGKRQATVVPLIIDRNALRAESERVNEALLHAQVTYDDGSLALAD